MILCEGKCRSMCGQGSSWSGGSSLTNEVRCIVDASAPLILSGLRIRAQWARAVRLAVDNMGGQDAVGSHALLDPFYDRAKLVKRPAADTSGAMEHARDHEQPEEARRSGAHPGRHAFVVVDAGLGVQSRIGPAEVHQQLSAALFETR